MDHVQPFERWDDPSLPIPEPVDDPCFAGLFDQFQAIAADCRVVLSGEGNDSLMHFQMWPYVKDMIRNREWQNLLADNLRDMFGSASPPCPQFGVRLGLFRNDGSHSAMSALAGTGLRAPIGFARARERVEPGRAWFSVAPGACQEHTRRFRRTIGATCSSSKTPASRIAQLRFATRFSICASSIICSRSRLFLCFSIRNYCARHCRPPPGKNSHPPQKSRGGDPLVAHFGQRQSPWIDQLAWTDEINSYVDKSVLAHVRKRNAFGEAGRKRSPALP